MSGQDPYVPRPPEMFQPGGVVFLGEQDGIPERELKTRLIELFKQTKRVSRAYLAIVRYDLRSPLAIALCLQGRGAPDPGLVKEIGKIFASMFAGRQHLDIMFLESPKQTEELSKVCSPFYAIGSSGDGPRDSLLSKLFWRR